MEGQEDTVAKHAAGIKILLEYLEGFKKFIVKNAQDAPIETLKNYKDYAESISYTIGFLASDSIANINRDNLRSIK